MSRKFVPKVELRPIGDVRPYEKNAKIHTESQIEDLAKVIKTQGWDVPIVVDTHGVIIKGHGRRLAALALGLKEVPVIVRTDMTDAQVKAARLSDNRVAFGDYDTELLRDELRVLQSMDDEIDMTALGFANKELEMLIGELDVIADDAFTDSEVGEDTAATTAAGAPASSAEPSAESADGVIPVVQILGFKLLPKEYERAIGKFMAFAESETGVTNADAFGRFCQSVVRYKEANA